MAVPGHFGPRKSIGRLVFQMDRLCAAFVSQFSAELFDVRSQAPSFVGLSRSVNGQVSHKDRNDPAPMLPFIDPSELPGSFQPPICYHVH